MVGSMVDKKARVRDEKMADTMGYCLAQMKVQS